MKNILFFVFLFISGVVNAQKGKVFISSWNEEGISELNTQQEKYTYFRKGELYCFMSNDETNIYIDMKFLNPVVHKRILKEGLIVWVSMENKPSKKLGIRFPVGTQNIKGNKEPDTQSSFTNAADAPATPLSLADKIELIGFRNEEARVFPAENSDNFSGSLKYDKKGILHYKLIMPIAKLPVRNSKENNGAMPFTIGIQYGAVIVNSRGNMAPPPPLAPPAGGVRRRSSGEGGQSRGTTGSRNQGKSKPGAGTESSQNSAPPVLLWIKNIRLATDK